jgi:WASH complex subunit 7
MASLDFAANPGKEEQEIFFEKLRMFVAGHERTMLETEQSFNSRWDGTVWDAATDSVPVDLSCFASDATVADTLGRSKLHNRLFFRITMAFASLVLEMRSLTEEAFDIFIPPLSVFGDENGKEEAISDEEAQRGVGRMMLLFQDVWNWVNRVNLVVLNVMRQLAALYSPAHARDNYHPYTQVHFPLVWHALVDLIGAVVSLEEVLNANDAIRQGLNVYHKMLTNITKNIAKFKNTEEVEVEQIGKLLKKIERDLLDDGIMERLVNQMFDCPAAMISNNNVFYAEFNRMFSLISKAVDEGLCTPRESEGRKKYVGILGMFFLHFRIFKEKLRSDTSTQKSFCRDVFEMHRKVPVIYICGLNIIRPAQWMAKRAPTALNGLVRDPVKEGMSSIKAECQRAAGDFVPRLNLLTTLTASWVAQMESTVPCDRARSRQFVTTSTQLVQKGILFAQDLSRTVKNLIFVHQCADLPLTLPMVDGVAQACEQLMMLRTVYHNKTGIIASTFSTMVQAVSFAMQRNLYNLYQRLNDVLQTSPEAVTDQHSAIGQALALLQKPPTPQNLVCLDVVLSIAFQRNDCAFQQKDFEDTLSHFAQLVRLVNYQRFIRTSTDCDFLYWQRDGFYPLFLQRKYQNPGRSEFLPYLIAAMHDCRSTILSAKHVERSTDLLDEYANFIRDIIKKNIVDPLCTEIENDLRLYTHGVVLGQPFKKIEKNQKDLARFTMLGPMRFFNEWLHIAMAVEDYLDQQFYNLNALMSNDWKTYEEMRNLALERYGLRICEGYLPGSIVDQGLDVLVITEKITAFVADYTYNLNEQLFVQRPAITESKHLNTLHIRHVANSIRTHGTGIMNTAVNYVYKCLLKKLAILSQFLYDDYVKSRLLKDIKYFSHHKDELKGFYPIQRAEKYCFEIRKLGLTEDGRTYLDQARQLISEIGNALGYMRMVRSGGLRATAESAVFIPELHSIPHLEKFVNKKAKREGEEGNGDDDDVMIDEDEDEEEEQPQVTASTVEALRNVDTVVFNMHKKLAQGSDYFKMLTEALAKKLKDPEKYGHLKNFWMMIPPLCMTHVEFMVRQKEQLVKKNKEGLFTDDGFALGCTFLLSLFGVYEMFESTHWFEGVGKHYADRQREMEAGIAARNEKKKKSKDQQEQADDDLRTMQLTQTMLECSTREYEDLEYAFTSCRVFFQYRPTAADDENEDEEEEEDA